MRFSKVSVVANAREGRGVKGEQKKEMNKARSKLSPWPYIRNNRVRTTALIVSLSAFILMMYVVNYVIGGMDEPFYAGDVAPYERIQIVSSNLGLNGEDYESDDEYMQEAWVRARAAAETVSKEDGVIDAKPFAWQYVILNSVIGNSSMDCFLFENASDCEDYLKHMDAKLASGRMPEKAGEILVDKKLEKNHSNDGELLEYLGRKYEVVGTVDSDYYLAFGIEQPGENDINILIMTKEGSQVDGKALFEKTGYEVWYYRTLEKAKANHEDSLGSMGIVQTLLTAVSGALLLICVSVVLALHIMDRHNEWCLLNSIGFSTGEIFVMALKEILICIALSIVVGAVLCAIVVFGLKTFLYDPLGIYIKSWRPAALPRIGIVFLALLGFAQIPIFNGMRKIQTIDTIES